MCLALLDDWRTHRQRLNCHSTSVPEKAPELVVAGDYPKSYLLSSCGSETGLQKTVPIKLARVFEDLRCHADGLTQSFVSLSRPNFPKTAKPLIKPRTIGRGAVTSCLWIEG